MRLVDNNGHLLMLSVKSHLDFLPTDNFVISYLIVLKIVLGTAGDNAGHFNPFLLENI